MLKQYNSQTNSLPPTPRHFQTRRFISAIARESQGAQQHPSQKSKSQMEVMSLRVESCTLNECVAV